MGSDHGGFALFVEFDFISIHAPRMRSDVFVPDAEGFAAISIHAPRMGSDLSSCSQYPHLFISIHAPRMGSDFPLR